GAEGPAHALPRLPREKGPPGGRARATGGRRDRGGGAPLRGDAAARPAHGLRPRLRRDAAPPPRSARRARPLASRGRRPRARTARGSAGRDADARPALDPSMSGSPRTHGTPPATGPGL